MGDWEALLKETEALTRHASQIALQARTRLVPELKPDGSIVTNGDREVETFLREELLKLTPGAGFWGEEFGFSPPTDQGFWLLDPIDGTSNYRFGQPLWGVTVGFMHGGRLRVGCLDMPDLDCFLSAAEGQGATRNGVVLPPIPPGPIRDEELFGHTDLRKLLPKTPGKVRHLGAFVVEAAFVALQSMRAMTAGRVKLYDAAGGIVILRELNADLRHYDGVEFDEAKWCEPKTCDPFMLGPRDSNFPFGLDL